VLGGTIPVSYSGEGLARAEVYSTTYRPSMALVTFVTALPYVAFYPHFTSTLSKTVLFNYYKAPATLTGAGVVIEVNQLEETMLAALCKDLIRFHGMSKDGAEQAQYFAQEERVEYRSALRYLYTSHV
jgi:hypothetical protein